MSKTLPEKQLPPQGDKTFSALPYRQNCILKLRSYEEQKLVLTSSNKSFSWACSPSILSSRSLLFRMGITSQHLRNKQFVVKEKWHQENISAAFTIEVGYFCFIFYIWSGSCKQKEEPGSCKCPLAGRSAAKGCRQAMLYHVTMLTAHWRK